MPGTLQTARLCKGGAVHGELSSDLIFRDETKLGCTWPLTDAKERSTHTKVAPSAPGAHADAIAGQSAQPAVGMRMPPRLLRRPVEPSCQQWWVSQYAPACWSPASNIKHSKHMAYEGAKQFTENQLLGCATGKVARGPLL